MSPVVLCRIFVAVGLQILQDSGVDHGCPLNCQCWSRNAGMRWAEVGKGVDLWGDIGCRYVFGSCGLSKREGRGQPL
jgi:hypothetical protein